MDKINTYHIKKMIQYPTPLFIKKKLTFFKITMVPNLFYKLGIYKFSFITNYNK